jgi:hypothetical protein
VTGYKLWEATNSAYVGETVAYTGTSPAALSGRGSGTYYYRVQACVGALCGSARLAGNAIIVSAPPAAPGSITVPATSSTGSYTITWTAPSGGAPTGYELYESTSSSFTTQTLVYSGANLSAPISGRTNGTYYYRVRACNGAGCGGYIAGANGIVVSTTTVPSVPTNLRKSPTTGTGGNFSILWDASTGTVNHYTLEETQTAPTPGVTTYSVTGTSKSFSKGNDYFELSYRVRACATSNESQCSAYTSGSVFKLVCPTSGCP